MSDDNKIVPFPTHKVRKMGEVTRDSSRMSAQSRRVTLVVSLVSTVFVATLINSRVNNGQQSSSSQGRGLASTTDFNDDILLAKKIARESLRQPSARGRQPTSEEILQFQTLNRSYLLVTNDNGALVSIQYNENAGQIRALPDRVKFLKDNDDLLKIGFDEVSEKPLITTSEKYKFEVYELKRKNQKEAAAKVHFTFDHSNYFISMKVESGS